MISRYDVAFSQCAARKQAAFVPFAVAGDPDIDVSESILRTYLDAGADVLEIGYPFSDPVADGPVNQRAGIRAIAAGLNHARFFSLVRKIRATTDVPIGVLLYANTIRHLGYEHFCQKAASAGIDSLLVADMPPEEATELNKAMRRYDIGTVFIVSELTPPSRIKFICKQVDAFVYVVSRLGPTGVQTGLSATVKPTLDRLRQHTNKPLCVGFGLSRPEHVRDVVKAGADGAIVGSALVQTIETHASKPRLMLQKLLQQARALKSATHVRP